MKIERDEIEITGGVRGGETLGSPIAITIRNADFENWKGAMDPWDVDAGEAGKRRVHAPRPGHVDLAGGMKYGRRDLRDVLERACILVDGDVISERELASSMPLPVVPDLRPAPVEPASAAVAPEPELLTTVEREHIQRALARAIRYRKS